MNSRRVLLQPVWILARRAYRESSLLLECLSRDHGRVGLVARGARGGRNSRSALLQPLQPLLLSWTERGDLGALTGVEAAGMPQALGGETLFSAWYINELLLRGLQRHDPHPGLFNLYAQTLVHLAHGDVAPVLREFEAALLAELGYGLSIPADLDVSACYDFEPGSGLHLTADGPYAGACLAAARDGRWNAPGVAQSLKPLLRDALRRVVGDRPLQTPRLLRELRRTVKGGE
jgi:DNA repair protein RecO (recombination protein O)